MGVATKSRVIGRTKSVAEIPSVRRVQVTMSEKTFARLLKQADDVGISVAQYATVVLAQASFQIEQTQANMPEMMRHVGSEVGKRLPMDSDGE